MTDRPRREQQASSLSLVSVPLMPAQRTVCQVGATLSDKHRRRNARRTSPSRAERMIDGPRRRESAGESAGQKPPPPPPPPPPPKEWPPRRPPSAKKPTTQRIETQPTPPAENTASPRAPASAPP